MSPHATNTEISIKDFPPTPKVSTFDIGAPTGDIIKGLGEAGGCIIKNFVSQEVIQGLAKDFEPLLDAEKDKWTGKAIYQKL